jgi:hypothetical protein
MMSDTETQTLTRELDALRETVQRTWFDLDELALTARERSAIRRQVRACAMALADLDTRLGEIDYYDRA